MSNLEYVYVCVCVCVCVCMCVCVIEAPVAISIINQLTASLSIPPKRIIRLWVRLGWYPILPAAFNLGVPPSLQFRHCEENLRDDKWWKSSYKTGLGLSCGNRTHIQQHSCTGVLCVVDATLNNWSIGSDRRLWKDLFAMMFFRLPPFPPLYLSLRENINLIKRIIKMGLLLVLAPCAGKRISRWGEWSSFFEFNLIYSF